MANFFDGKQYSEYFEKLNNRLSSTDKKENTSPTGNVTPHLKNKKGFYKVFRLKKGVLIGVAAVVVAIVLIIVTVSSCNGDSSSSPDSEQQTEQKVTEEKAEKKNYISYTQVDTPAEIPETNDAKTAIIIRKSDNKIIAGRNIHERVYPASTLKIMTLLTAVENITDFNETFTMSLDITDPLYVAEASVAGFLSGEVINMTDLLYGMILPSGADAAMGLAIKIAGSEEGFVKLMNKRAAEMGLQGTHFANVTGLHHKDNYSTAYDMAIILDTAYQNELCREILSTYQYTTAKTPQNPKGIALSSTLFNHMYGTEPETATILGGKTGYVNEAGYCVATFGENKAKTEQYIVVTMGNSSKWPAFHGQIALYKQFAK